MANCAASKLGIGIYTFLFVAGWMGLAVPSSMGQAVVATTNTTAAPTSSSYVPTMTFDIASVRESSRPDWSAGYTMSGQFLPHTSMLRVINWQIGNLISTAYGVNEAQIQGVPKWPFPTLFVVVAKGDSQEDAKLMTLTAEQQWAEQKHMLQTLLEDRFSLKTHWEMKEGDVYHLVVAKGGPKLSTQGLMPPSADELKNFGDSPVPTSYQKSDG